MIRTCRAEGCNVTVTRHSKAGFCMNHRTEATRLLAAADPTGRRYCATDGCANVLRSHNKTGHCKAHDNEGRRVFRKKQRVTCCVTGCPGLVQANNTTGYCRQFHRAEQVQLYNRRREMRKAKVFVEHVNRHELFRRDNGTCHICGTLVDPMSWHLDHIIPLNLFGPHCYANTAVSHPHCNTLKNATVASGSRARLDTAAEAYALFHSL